MIEHDDERIDAALEALARPEPPADHVARVLARTGPDAATAGSASRPYPLRRTSPLVWSLAAAASVLVALGVTWQVARLSSELPDAVAARSASGPSQPQVWGAPQAIDRPVLPPQAYWGMDAFTEFETLRPGAQKRPETLDHRNSGTQGRSSGHQGRRAEGQEAAARATETARSESGYVPMLPAIELESIVPAPLVVAPLVMAPLAPLEDIAIMDIPLAPIAIDALIEEERP